MNVYNEGYKLSKSPQVSLEIHTGPCLGNTTYWNKVFKVGAASFELFKSRSPSKVNNFMIDIF